MREKPILFSTPMVKAILDDRKTQTRRVIKPQPGDHPDDDGYMSSILNRCPYQVGDILYVRETWADLRGMGFGNDPRTDKPWNFAYKADIKPGSESDRARIDFGVKWRPSIHMPKEAARLLLTVKGVKVERLQDITEEDALKEGCLLVFLDGAVVISAKGKFHALWDSINGKKHPWGSNPYVWAISFERRVG